MSGVWIDMNKEQIIQVNVVGFEKRVFHRHLELWIRNFLDIVCSVLQNYFGQAGVFHQKCLPDLNVTRQILNKTNTKVFHPMWECVPLLNKC